MRTFTLATVMAFSALFLMACMVPEKFTAKYTLTPKGDFTFAYDGTMVNALARTMKLEAKEKGKEPTAGDQAKLREMVGEFERDPRVKEFKETSNDVYKVVMQEQGNIKERRAVAFWNEQIHYWKLSYNEQDKTAVLAVKPVKDMRDFDRLGITPDWNIQIATDCAVVSSTVELDKSFFGNTYKFSIKRDDLKNGVTVVLQLE